MKITGKRQDHRSYGWVLTICTTKTPMNFASFGQIFLITKFSWEFDTMEHSEKLAHLYKGIWSLVAYRLDAAS